MLGFHDSGIFMPINIMALKKIFKPKPVITSTTIDADVLARINAKIAKAHEQIEERGKTKKPLTRPVITHDTEPEVKEEPEIEPEPIINDDAETGT
jgi:hypothetical protein